MSGTERNLDSRFLKLSVLALVLLFNFLPGLASTARADGTWPMWRRDAALTAFQPMPGAMKTEPRVLGKYFLGSRHGNHIPADLRGTGEKSEFLVTARARLFAYDAKGKALWESAPEGYIIDRVEWVDDFDGDGRNEVVAVASHMGLTRQAYVILDAATGVKRAAIEINTGDYGWRGHCGPYLPGAKGKQIFVLCSARQSEKGISPAASNGEGMLWSYDGKRVQRRWTWTPPEYVLFYPAAMVADLNGDKHFYAVLNSWCHVWQLDLATGKAVTHLVWDPQGANQRQYGWNELVDVNADGKLDYVNIALTKHVDVLRNVNGTLQLGWTRGWPDPVTTEARSIHSPAAPVVDLDGDGKMELISALFDGLTDKRWHLSIWNAATGEERLHATNLVPLASAPLWGTNSGRALLCARTSKLSFEPPDGFEAFQFTNGELKSIWSSAQEEFVLESVPSDDRRALYFSAMKGKAATTGDVDGDGRREFFTRSGTNKETAWGINASGKVVAKSGAAPKVASVVLLKKVPALQGTTVPHLLAADIDGDKRNELLLYDNTTVTTLRLRGRTLKKGETFPSSEIPIICDLLGNGKPCVLTAGRGSDSNLWVQAQGPKSETLWRYVFPDSGACGQYSERPVFFTIGHFTGGRYLDIFTYSTKPSARTYVLDGRTGRPVWERVDMPAIERHYHPLGGRTSVWDFNRDGADDAVFCNPDFYCVADGRKAELLVGPVNIQPLLDWWAAYASPAVLPRAKDEPFIYLGGAYSSRGSISLDGKRGLWREYLPTERWPLRPGNSGFVEGLLPPSGEIGWRVGQVEVDGTLVCFDAATGKHAWKMQLPTATSEIVSGDIDGDGAPEFIFGGQDGNLVVLRDAGDHGEILWRKRFDAPCGRPILADLTGDSRTEIVVSVADGFVYVLGK